MPDRSDTSSRIPGFYRESVADRRDLVARRPELSEASAGHFSSGGGLDLATADRMSENVVGVHGLPLSVGLNFIVNRRELLVPMSTEEPSVVAAASNAARLCRSAGGFVGEATEAVMTAQVQLEGVPDAASAPTSVAANAEALLAAGNAAIPRMVKRGGGCRDLEARVLDVDEGIVVLHVHINVGDAMGANMVDSVAEAVAPAVCELLGGQIGLRILTNLGLRRMVTVRATATLDAIGSAELADAIVRASRIAEMDPFRAVTHNKGIMNGIDAVALALGQDWRAIEAGAHGYAAHNGRYGPLATWKMGPDGLDGVIEMPLAAATVGGSTRVHPGVRAGLDLLDVGSAGELAIVMASVGLASNLAALRALAGEGIQKGHMRLHHRKSIAPA